MQKIANRNHVASARHTVLSKNNPFTLIYQRKFKLTTHHFGDQDLRLESKSKNKRKNTKYIVNDAMFTITNTMTKSGKNGSSPECESMRLTT